MSVKAFQITCDSTVDSFINSLFRLTTKEGDFHYKDPINVESVSISWRHISPHMGLVIRTCHGRNSTHFSSLNALEPRHANRYHTCDISFDVSLLHVDINDIRFSICSKCHLWTVDINRLVSWGRDKVDAISQTTFSKCNFLNENVWLSIKISLTFVPKGHFNNIPALVQIMAWRRPGDKPLSEPMMASLPTHICVTRPQWVNIMTFDCLFSYNQLYFFI